jgi:hypothetical protein
MFFYSLFMPSLLPHVFWGRINKTDSHDINEILLKEALNTITLIIWGRSQVPLFFAFNFFCQKHLNLKIKSRFIWLQDSLHFQKIGGPGFSLIWLGLWCLVPLQLCPLRDKVNYMYTTLCDKKLVSYLGLVGDFLKTLLVKCPPRLHKLKYCWQWLLYAHNSN